MNVKITTAQLNSYNRVVSNWGLPTHFPLVPVGRESDLVGGYQLVEERAADFFGLWFGPPKNIHYYIGSSLRSGRIYIGIETDGYAHS